MGSGLIEIKPSITIREAGSYAFGAASLIYLPVWGDIFAQRGTVWDQAFIFNHHEIEVFSRLDYAAGAVATLGLAGALWIFVCFLSRLWPRSASRITQTISVCLLLLWVNVFRTQYFTWASSDFLKAAFSENLIIATACLLAILVILFYVRGPFLAFLYNLTRFCGVFGAIVLFNAVAAMVVLGTASLMISPSPLATNAGETNAPTRLVWVIFDEMDYRLAFENRPPGIQLKQFDKLQRKSFFAEQATSPGRSTFPSLPALLHGKLIAEASYADPSGPIVRMTSNSTPETWSSISNIFRNDMLPRGYRSAGYSQAHIPLCRVLGDALHKCWEYSQEWPHQSMNALQRVPHFVYAFLGYIPVLNRLLAPEKFDIGISYENFKKTTEQSIKNPSVDLVFIHWMVPHTPYVYDGKSKQYLKVINEERPERYFDNMMLADKITENIFTSLRKSGLHQETAVLISSDHNWRRSKKEWDGILDRRVPFIIVLPNGGKPHRYKRPFNTKLSRALIVKIMSGQIKSNTDIAEFISKRTSNVINVGETPKSDR